MNDLKEIGGFIVSADPYVNHDNSLSGNGTLTSPLGVVPGYNETVLWSGDLSSTSGNSTGTYSEPLSSFETIRMKWRNNDYGSEKYAYFPGSGAISYLSDIACNRHYWKSITVVNNTNTSFNAIWGYEKTITNTANAAQVGYFHLLEVVGINRKQ